MIDHRGHAFQDREPSTPCQFCGMTYSEMFDQHQKRLLLDCTQAETDRIWRTIQNAATT